MSLWGRGEEWSERMKNKQRLGKKLDIFRERAKERDLSERQRESARNWDNQETKENQL